MNPDKMPAKDVKKHGKNVSSLDIAEQDIALPISSAKMPRICCLPIAHQNRHGDWRKKSERLGNYVISESSPLPKFKLQKKNTACDWQTPDAENMRWDPASYVLRAA